MNPNGFQTNVWGPAAWLFLHCVTLNYDPSRGNRKETMQFFKTIAYVLPCGACRDNYHYTIQHSKELALTRRVFESRETLSLWLFKLHNYVTRCVTQSDFIPYGNSTSDYKKMVAFYEQFRAKCSSNSTTNARSHKGGCTQPLKNGIRLRTEIRIKPFVKKSIGKVPSIAVVGLKK